MLPFLTNAYTKVEYGEQKLCWAKNEISITLSLGPWATHWPDCYSICFSFWRFLLEFQFRIYGDNILIEPYQFPIIYEHTMTVYQEP